jgi:hypothetical protein
LYASRYLTHDGTQLFSATSCTLGSSSLILAAAEQGGQGEQVVVVDPDQVVFRGGDFHELEREREREERNGDESEGG